MRVFTPGLHSRRHAAEAFSPAHKPGLLARSCSVVRDTPCRHQQKISHSLIL